MFSYLLFSTSLLLAFIYSVDSVCICNVRYNGEYCGTQLNRLNGNNNCTRDQYFCGDDNRNKSAVIIKRCSPGNECDVIKNGGQNLRNLKNFNHIFTYLVKKYYNHC